MCKMFKGKSQQKKMKIVFITLLKQKHAPVVRRMPWPWTFRIVTGLFPSQQLLSVGGAGKPVTGER